MLFPCSFLHALMTIRAALDRALVLLSMKREIMRLDNVWGVGGGQRPVKHLIKEVRYPCIITYVRKSFFFFFFFFFL